MTSPRSANPPSPISRGHVKSHARAIQRNGLVTNLTGKILLCWLATTCVCYSATDYYVGTVAGLATLSADGRSAVSPDQSLVSVYKPENGPAVNVFFGRYLGGYVSLQANYIWNSNSLTLNSTAATSSGPVFYQESRNSSQTSGI